MPATIAPLRVEFPGALGEPLAGRLELPVGTPAAYALFAHCFTCGKDAIAATRISRALTEAGIAVLRFDFTGLGHSGGDFGNSNFSSNLDDLVCAAEFLAAEHQAPSLLIGHSLGGAAVLAVASRISGVRAVATIAAPADPRHLTTVFAEQLAEIEKTGSAMVNLGGREFRIRRQFLNDLKEQRQCDRIAELDAALLVMHSPEDAIVPVDNARVIFDAARHPKSFVSLDGSDHLLTTPGDAAFAASMIGIWARRYLPSPPETEAESDAPASVTEPDAAPEVVPSPTVELPAGAVRVTESGEGPYGQVVETAHHRITSDEPTPLGHDTGMSPYELLLASLGGCTSMTLRMYAARKKWPLEQVEVTLTYARARGAAKDAGASGETAARSESIHREILLRGELSAEQRAALLEIADRCPVHRTMHNDVTVTTELTDSSGSDQAAPRAG